MRTHLRLTIVGLACLALVRGAVASTAGQGPAECTSVDCAPRGNAVPGVAPSIVQQVWQEAGELAGGVAAMRTALLDRHRAANARDRVARLTGSP